MLLVLAAPCHLRGWAGQEHGGSIPLNGLLEKRKSHGEATNSATDAEAAQANWAWCTRQSARLHLRAGIKRKQLLGVRYAAQGISSD